MTKKPAASATKSQILEAFDELLNDKNLIEKEKENLAKELIQLKKQKVAPVVPINPSPITVNNANISKEKPDMTNKQDHTLKLLTEIQRSFTSTITEISEKLSKETSEFNEVYKQVQDETTQLKALYGIEVIDDQTLSGLINKYEAADENFEKTFKQKQTELEDGLADLQKAWNNEQQTRDQTFKEKVSAYEQKTQRENNEYTYNLKQERQIWDETYAEKLKKQAQTLGSAEEIQIKEWDKREKELATQEKLNTEASEKVAKQADEKEAAIKKAKEEGKGIGSYQAKIKSDLFAKEIQGQERIYQQRIRTLEQGVESNDAKIAKLSAQLETVLRQAQDLAMKAIEGAANASSLQSFKELAMEQAKAQAKGK